MELPTIPRPHFWGFYFRKMMLLTLDLITARQKGKKLGLITEIYSKTYSSLTK